MDIKRNDNKRVITDTLTFGGSPQNLTAATVRFLMKTVPGSANRNLSFAIAASIEDALAGEVSAELTADMTEVAGKYNFEWEVTFADDSVTTFPSTGYGTLNIVEDLG
jgi:hypothetical protein